MQDRIPSFDLKRNYESIREEIKEAVNDVLESQYFVMSPEVSSFEGEAAAYLGVEHAVSCASGSDALLLALMGLDVRPGDEIVTTPFTFFATAGCIARLGARPVFVDVDPDDMGIDPKALEAAITSKTKACIPVHLFGQLCRIDEMTDLLSTKGVPIIEDCAQAFGAHKMIDGHIKRSGSFGKISCWSFYPTKNLGAYGDAGMMTTSDPDLAARLKRLRVHGESSTYIHEEVGVNSRMDSLQAAILRVRLRHIEEWTEARRAAAERYSLLFAELGLLDAVRLPKETPGCRHTYHQYVVRVERRDELQKHLADKGIVTRVYYPLALHMQPCFAYAGYKKGDMPAAERLCEEVLALPMFPELQEAEQERVVREIANFYGRR